MSSHGDTELQHARSHIYPPPPSSHCASNPEAENLPSSSILQRIARVFKFWGKRNSVMTSAASQTDSTDSREVMSAPSNPSVPLSQTPSASGSARSESSGTKSRSKKAAAKPALPITVPSWRYKAKTQKFIVREEHEFSVTCAVVQPTLRFHWPGFLKFNRLRCFRRRTKKDAGTEIEGKSIKRWRRFSRGVAVEQDVCDDLQEWYLVEPHKQAPTSAPEPAPAPRRPRKPRPQSHSQHMQNKEKRLAATRRNSGWAGVFASTAYYPDSSGTSTNPRTGTSSGASLPRSRSRSRSRDEGDEETAGFTIDRNSKTLVVPDVDIGIARIVEEEIEKYASPEEASIRLVRPRARNLDETLEYDAFGRDSLESWLDLE